MLTFIWLPQRESIKQSFLYILDNMFYFIRMKMMIDIQYHRQDDALVKALESLDQ